MVNDYENEEETTEESTEDSGDDLRASLESAFEAESEASTEALEDLAAQTKDEDTRELARESKVRDENGRFSKSAKPDVKESLQPQEAQNHQALADDTSLPPPNTWKQEKQELFKQLPRPLQEEISRRELERERYVTQKGEEFARYRRKFQDIEEAFEPHQQELDLAGVSSGQVVKQLLSMQTWMQKEPKAAINHILASYNLTPQDLMQQAQEQPAADPRFQSLQEELEQLKGYISTQQEREANQSHQQVETEIQSFANEKNADGNLARPYFRDVYYEMLPIAQALREANPTASHRDVLDAAYDRAIYSHPEVRKNMIGRLTQSSEAKRINDAKSQAQKARVAGSSVKGAPGGSVAPVVPDDLRATIEQAFEDYRL